MDYRAYLIDPADGHFVGVHEIEAPDDEAAVIDAKKYADGRDVEVWHRGRRVARIVWRDGSIKVAS